MCSVGIQECTGNIDDLFSSPGEYQTRVLGYDCNFGCLQVLFCGIFQELLTVFRVDDNGHTLLGLGDGDLGSVEAGIFFRYFVQIDLKARCQLADGNGNSACTEVVAFFNQKADFLAAEQSLQFTLSRCVSFLYLCTAGLDGFCRMYFGGTGCTAAAVSSSTAEDGCSDVVTELDVQLLIAARRKDATFTGDAASYVVTEWGEGMEETVLTRPFGKYPYRPDDPADYHAAAKRLLHMQAASLVRRMQYANLKHPVVGISGGVDSTLAVIICAEAVKMMGLPADYVTAVTMPCFGTTDRTKSNAIIVSEQLGATVRVIDIGESVMQHFKDIGHDPENRNVVYENSQARERTQILMDVANGFADGGIHVGTEDMSEFADGWCTYNGDHISMYDVNAGSTKTMVQMVVRYVAETTEDKVLAKALLDVLDTPVSPELLPPTRNGEIAQKSEDSVGPYNLQDFFLYYLVDHGFAPEKVLRLADIAYGDEFDHATLKKWLRSYCRRLFSQQFKRSCLQDGPTLNGFSFSPRTGFSMPSDGSDALYLATVDALK